jgi:hypothetical protein
MPQVLTDPTLNPGVITNGGTDLFSFPNVSPASVLGLQAPATQPLPPGTETATNLLSPGLQVAAQLVNFPPSVYDTTPASLLSHFMTALLGNSGAGQLRKRQMVARLQQALTSTRFYDLDSFYGALFGAQRGPSGALPVNPATGLPVDPYGDLASPDAWDEVEAADATFRERIIQLARAITLGATVPGMQALAEAITGVQCTVWEVWRLLEDASGPAPGYQTWEEVSGQYADWSSFPQGTTWQAVEGAVLLGGVMGNGTPNEIVIRPKKSYSSSVADQQQMGADMLGILSVAEVLRPAASLITVDTTAPVISVPVQAPSAWADSQYWEIVRLVTPLSPSSAAYAAIASSYQAGNAAELPPGTYVVPSPPLSRTTGSQYSYAADVTTVSAAAATGSSPNSAQVTDGLDFETVVFPSPPPPPPRRGVTQVPLPPPVSVGYLPSEAVMPPGQAQTARTASPVTVIAAPYSGPRVPVMRST